MDLSVDLQELVERRGSLRARMLELRARSPEDHDGFLRTVDQLLAVSDRIVELVSAPPETAPPAEGAQAPGTGGSDPEGVSHEGPSGTTPQDRG